MIVSIALLTPVLLLSHTALFPFALAILTLFALFEVFRCIKVAKNLLLTIPLYAMGTLLPFVVRYLPASSKISLCETAVLLTILLMLYILALLVFTKHKTSCQDAGVAFFFALYIIFGFSGIVYLRDLDNPHIYLLILVGAWTTDVFAYLTGISFGRHKLIPEISPKKTIEGSVGGSLAGTAAIALTSYLIGISDIGWGKIIAGGILVAIIAQIGDLAMSAIKRQYGIKDFGGVFPGHGGVLDRFDSVLSVSSVMTILFALINILR